MFVQARKVVTEVTTTSFELSFQSSQEVIHIVNWFLGHIGDICDQLLKFSHIVTY